MTDATDKQRVENFWCPPSSTLTVLDPRPAHDLAKRSVNVPKEQLSQRERQLQGVREQGAHATATLAPTTNLVLPRKTDSRNATDGRSVGQSFRLATITVILTCTAPALCLKSCTQLAHGDLAASGSIAALKEHSADRPLYGLKRFSTTIAKHLNDLPITSPHGSDFDATRKLLKLHQFEWSTRHSDGTPRQVLRHPSDFRVVDEAKSANAEIRKAMEDHPLPS